MAGRIVEHPLVQRVDVFGRGSFAAAPHLRLEQLLPDLVGHRLLGGLGLFAGLVRLDPLDLLDPLRRRKPQEFHPPGLGHGLEPFVVVLHHGAELVGPRVPLDRLVQLAEPVLLGWRKTEKPLLALQQPLLGGRVHLLHAGTAFFQQLVAAPEAGT